jgi:hypothetical protein
MKRLIWASASESSLDTAPPNSTQSINSYLLTPKTSTIHGHLAGDELDAGIPGEIEQLAEGRIYLTWRLVFLLCCFLNVEDKSA